MPTRRWRLGVLAGLFVVCCLTKAGAQTRTLETEEGWWMTPHRLLQTNLREIDATMDIDQYVREVKDFGANIVLFNVGGIVANYPTELEYHWRNTFMDGDLVGEALEKLHANGIQMIGRFDFSKVNEEYAFNNPEWLYVSESGEHVNYNGQVHTCVMGQYQQEYMLAILAEALTRYPLDGVFFNMIGFPQVDYSRVFHGICQCDNCKRSFQKYSGLDLPKHDGDPEALAKHQEWKRVQIDSQFRRVREKIKSIRPQTVICTYTIDYIDVIRKESGAPLGQETWDDVERSQWTLLTTDDKQLANASVHFYQMIFRHSAAAPYLHSRRLWQQVVNGAWLDFYCIGPLQRLEDRAGIPAVSDIYRFHAANEQWMLHTESAAEVGLVRQDGDDYWGWVQILAENQIPYGLVSFGHSDLNRYKVLIVPESGELNQSETRTLDAYVRRGGQLALSGRIPDSLVSLGKPVLKKTWSQRHSMYVRITPEDKENVGVPGLQDFDLVQIRGDFHQYEVAEGTREMLRLIYDVMYGPPEKCYIVSESEIPAFIIRKHGEGLAACFPFQIGKMYREWGNQGHAMLATGVIKNVLASNLRLEVDCSHLVEVTHRKDPNGAFEWIAIYNHSGRLENSFHKPIPIRDIKIALEPRRKVKHVRLLKDGSTLSATLSPSGVLRATVPELQVFETILVEYQD